MLIKYSGNVRLQIREISETRTEAEQITFGLLARPSVLLLVRAKK